MTDNYRDEMREAREALEDLLSFEYRRGVSCQKNAFALEGGGRRCLCNSCIEDRARAALSRLSAQADPALDAREFVRDWIVANHGVLSMAGAAAQDLIARLQARLSVQAEPAKDALKWATDFVMQYVHGSEIAGDDIDDLITSLAARLSASGQSQ